MKVHTNIQAGITVTAYGEYSDGGRPSPNTLTCDAARIEVGKYQRVLPANRIDHTLGPTSARCYVSIPNVPPGYAGNVIFDWRNYGQRYTTSVYMAWGEGDTDLGGIDLNIGKVQR
jgi:hypothetical protein